MSKFITENTVVALAIALVCGLGVWFKIYLEDSHSNNPGIGMSTESTLTVRKHNECASLRGKEGWSRKVSVYNLLMVAEIRTKEVDGKVVVCQHRLQTPTVTDWE